jgi:hypothetical protein
MDREITRTRFGGFLFCQNLKKPQKIFDFFDSVIYNNTMNKQHTFINTIPAEAAVAYERDYTQGLC